jgi:signal transduction histidine kinase
VITARRAGIVVAFLLALLAVTAVAVATSLLLLGRVPSGGERTVLFACVAGFVVAAVAFGPLRERAVASATRALFGARRPPEEVVRTFGDRASRGTAADELLLELAESLRRTLGLATAEVWITRANSIERFASSPERGHAAVTVEPAERDVLVRTGVAGRAWLALWAPGFLDGRECQQIRVAPAAHAGEVLGLVVAERPDHDPFTSDDDRALAELGRQLGVVLHNRRLDATLQETLDDLRRTNDELRASRARIVATANAERRRIERDLHDGAQQHLVAIAVSLGLVKNVMATDPETAQRLLGDVTKQVQETVQQVRDLAHGVYPPLLVEKGLGDALRAAANRAPLSVAVESDGVARYPGEVEAAVYFCCLEALQNASKHAPDAHVDVRLRQDATGLHFEVADDGPGFDLATARMGHGLQNMRDRVGAIGGTVTWDSAPGAGTRVIGAVPVAPEAEAH